MFKHLHLHKCHSRGTKVAGHDKIIFIISIKSVTTFGPQAIKWRRVVSVRNYLSARRQPLRWNIPCNSVSRYYNYLVGNYFIRWPLTLSRYIQILTLSRYVYWVFSVQAGARGLIQPLLDKFQSINAIMTKFGRDVDQLNVYLLGQKLELCHYFADISSFLT